MIPRTWNKVLELSSILVVWFGITGIALKLCYFWGHVVYFPLWPNVLDSLFLVLGALYLAIKGLKKK